MNCKQPINQATKVIFRLIFLLCLVPSFALAVDEPITLKLFSEYETVTPGSDYFLAAQVEIKEGWHIYWKEPGRFGLPTTFELEVDGEVTPEPEERWPIPSIKTHDDGERSFEYKKSFGVVFGPLQAKEAGELTVELGARWLACSDEICVPKRASASTEIKIGTSSDKKSPQFVAVQSVLPRLLELKIQETKRLEEAVFSVAVAGGELSSITTAQVIGTAGLKGVSFTGGKAVPGRLELQFSARKPSVSPPNRVDGFLVAPNPSDSRAFTAVSR